MPTTSARVIHFAYDALPRVTATARPGTVDLLVPFRVQAEPHEGLRVISWRLAAEVDGQPWAHLSRARRITKELVALMRRQMRDQGQFVFDRVPPYLDMEGWVERDGVEYVEGCVPAVPAGSAVSYSLEVTLRRGQDEPVTVRSRTYTVHAVRPAFEREHIRRIHIPQPGDALHAWALYHRREAGFDHVRLDVVALEADPGSNDRRPGFVDLAIDVGDRTVALGDPDLAVLPMVDTAADSVTISVPVTGATIPTVAVRYRGAAEVLLDPAAPVEAGAARVMFVNFAIQGLNDYFHSADDVDYPRPRTYAQVTMRDEAAGFSSRPGSLEDATGDGYEFTLEAHRRYRIKQMWAINGGLLDLLAHDCPDDLERMRDDVASGLLVPVVAGFGAHRLPYYAEATNLDAIISGGVAMDHILGRNTPVYYPDSRLVTNRPNVTEALVKAGIEYIVVDAGEHENGLGERSTIVRDADPAMGAVSGGRWMNWQYLWRDRDTRIKILFIDPQMKDGLFGATDRDADRGKVSLDTRRKFIELAAQPRLRRDNLCVYSDDADKASGNGWFDGVYNGNAVQYNRKYQAALSWIAAHPWVQAITTDDLTDDDCVGELDLISASDPYITNNWRLPGIAPDPRHDYGLAFDTWYTAWSRVRAAWLGDTLGEISDRAERAIALRPRNNEMDELARLYLAMCLHESQWSKYARDAGIEAEDFVIAESIQLRNAHVYLAAGIWADWAVANRATPSAHRDSGPVIDAVAALDAAVDAGGAPPWRRPDRPGLQWDHDPLPNVILYNTEALVVLDRNGGRITHLFSMVDGRPCSVSGTFKAYQFLDLDWASDAGTKADGIVLQNTVHTPNHAYVACDVVAARGSIGAGPPDDVIFDWCYPDNFNAYRADGATAGDPSVTFFYDAGAPLTETPDTLQELDVRLEQDRLAKVAGDEGLVLHDVATYGRFSKTIRLDGRTVHVGYRDTRPGHVVANEFCVDLLAAALHGERQAQGVSADGRTATVRNAAKLAVDVTAGAGCEFTPATTAPHDPPTVETLRLHRVMTDNVEIVAPDGGDFDYRITLP